MFNKTLMTLDSISEMMLNCGGVGCQPVSINGTMYTFNIEPSVFLVLLARVAMSSLRQRAMTFTIVAATGSGSSALRLAGGLPSPGAATMPCQWGSRRP